MAHFSRRGVVAAAAAAATTLVSGCGGVTATPPRPARPSAPGGDARGRMPARPTALIGDGSMADTGAQPFQPTPQHLEPGQRPPQFVVFSWDGAGEDSKKLFSHFRAVAQETKATMSFFLSGIYVLPEGKKDLYLPPGHEPGASDIGYLADDHVKMTLEQVRLAWLEGHEIGTHFNGHFCSPTTGVGTWTPAQWRSELEQAIGFVEKWKTNTGYHDMDPLPFDYRKELIGGRTPCLLGQNQLLPTAAAMGWKYDASSPGGLQMWPGKKLGLWDFPLQSIPFPGHSFQVLSMDYNMLANQTGGTPKGDPSKRPYWQQQAYGSYMAGFNRAYTTNRAPFFVGNHFESWNGGIYMKAVEQALRDIAAKPDVRLVSFRQLVAWLEAQDPAVLAKLRTLAPGQAPGDWRDYTGGTPTAPAPARTPART
ncbi:polysaccharide deacetylase family protein [Streptacidiphilus rugosus]|uniref:lipoprotein n=1 Tax=Streptacidiphilus rugosus TaxID=405783 RepID=UPI00056CF242|nr:lipoprotein [Streptacidiphilus rugosus]